MQFQLSLSSTSAYVSTKYEKEGCTSTCENFATSIEEPVHSTPPIQYGMVEITKTSSFFRR